jgi:4,5-dihydroxyphthalate decarboxylase
MKLTIGCGAYDRTWPLIASAIRIAGIEFDWEILPPEHVFLRGMVGGEFQLSELSLGTYTVQLSRGTHRYRALPVFPSRAFRHSAIYVRADAGIGKPEQLKGRTIGVPEWQLTANVWARGILSDEYGVGVEDVHWFAGDIDEVGRTEKVPFPLPPRITLTPIGADQTLWSLMQQGKLDAIIAPRAPRAFVAGDPRVRRLFPDVKRAEQDYYARTGVFPIMHLLGIRNDVLAEHPGLPARLFAGFDQARRHGLQELGQVAYFYVMLPWLVDHLAETRRIMGEDYWPYGLEPNRRTLETFCRYAQEQGLTERTLSPDELFEPV